MAKRILLLNETVTESDAKGSKWLRARHPAPHEIDNREARVRSGADRYLEEVRDTVGFTRLDVTFEVDADSIAGDSASKVHSGDALRRAQHVIRIYRAHTQEVDVYIPQEGDSAIVELAVSDDYTFSEAETAGRFRVISQSFHWNSPEVTGILKQPMADTAVEGLLAQLADPTSPELYRELLVEAKALSKVRSLHALALVVMGAGLEAYLRSRLREECFLRGVIELTDDRGHTRRAEEAISDGDLKRDLLGKFAEALLGEPLKSSPAYTEWHQNAYGPRREIVHKGRNMATAEQAKAGFEAVVQLIQYVDERLTAARGYGGPSA